MPAPIRVLVVDDAVVVRRLITDALSGDAEIEIAGVAANGRIALQKIEQSVPDVITLDVEMPEMDGLETLVEIRKRWPALPVIMFSTLTERAARVTLDALTLGATDYVTKPANVGSVLAAQQRVRDELLPKIKLFGRMPHAAAGLRRASSVAAASPSALPSASKPVANTVASAVPAAISLASSRPMACRMLVIGASTGGPNALATLVAGLPALSVPAVIVQHMPPLFTRLLAERLARECASNGMQVLEASDGMPLEPGRILVAPGDHHVVFRPKGTRMVVELTGDPPVHSCRPAVDVTFRSAADRFGAETLGVVLTGMGQDGLAGAGAIKRRGGQMLVQDETTSVVWGMPGIIAGASLADEIVPIQQMSGAIVRRLPFASSPRVTAA